MKDMKFKCGDVLTASSLTLSLCPQDASAAGLSETEQEDTGTDDSLSNDEYECVSPDDISLPPLADTPESSVMQSDIEEGFCFSSHSVHINQYSRLSHVQSDHSRTGTETDPHHSSTRSV